MQVASSIGDCKMKNPKQQNGDLSVQTLITTMNLTEYKPLLSKMNVKRNYIIGNQCNSNYVETTSEGLIVATNMKGVGQNRNNIMERATADICVLADDDLRFCDDYESIVKKCFLQYPDADGIIFNFLQKSEGRRVVDKVRKIGYHNYMN